MCNITKYLEGWHLKKNLFLSLGNKINIINRFKWDINIKIIPN